MMDTVATRRAAQSHIEQLRLETPFHPRLMALSQQNDWYSWGGYKAPHSLWDEEMEYFAIRSQTAVFDISPMVKYRIEGPDAEAFCNRLTLRNVAKLKPGKVHYTAWCDDEGHVLDDGTLFRLTPTLFRLCCQERHLPWLLDSAIGFDVHIREETEQVAGLAVQGPTSCATLKAAGFIGIETMKPFDIRAFPFGSGEVIVTYRTVPVEKRKTGFIVANADFTTAEHAVRADRVRMPDEIGLDWMVDLDKPHFNGRRAIERARREDTLKHILVGLEIEGNVPAEHAIVYHRKTKECGLVSAAIWSPTGKRNIAIASLDRPYGSKIVDDLWVEIYAMRELRYQKLMKRARIVERPFVKLPRRTATPPADR